MVFQRSVPVGGCGHLSAASVGTETIAPVPWVPVRCDAYAARRRKGGRRDEAAGPTHRVAGRPGGRGTGRWGMARGYVTTSPNRGARTGGGGGFVFVPG